MRISGDAHAMAQTLAAEERPDMDAALVDLAAATETVRRINELLYEHSLTVDRVLYRSLPDGWSAGELESVLDDRSGANEVRTALSELARLAADDD